MTHLRPSNATNLPIAIFFHGGGFSNGFGSCYLGTGFTDYPRFPRTRGDQFSVQGPTRDRSWSVDPWLGWNFMEMDVIYVAVQYRLGIFGFMSTWGGSVEDNLLGGNYGLLDQQLAMRFLRDNAANLGGDPEKITIFGESAGGQSIENGFLVLREYD